MAMIFRATMKSDLLTWEQLEIIIKQHKKDWMAALQNQKAVYLIMDGSNGKLYVGSATSNNGMLLQRWENYNAKVDDSVILERESWWKKTLQSKKFRYNANWMCIK